MLRVRTETRLLSTSASHWTAGQATSLGQERLHWSRWTPPLSGQDHVGQAPAHAVQEVVPGDGVGLQFLRFRGANRDPVRSCESQRAGSELVVVRTMLLGTRPSKVPDGLGVSRNSPEPIVRAVGENQALALCPGGLQEHEITEILVGDFDDAPARLWLEKLRAHLAGVLLAHHVDQRIGMSGQGRDGCIGFPGFPSKVPAGILV